MVMPLIVGPLHVRGDVVSRPEPWPEDPRSTLAAIPTSATERNHRCVFCGISRRMPEMALLSFVEATTPHGRESTPYTPSSFYVS
ncbi:hypothetical protein GCM10010176_075840 [Nonomuraea spiralis]|nr:hypothetical protein GCM10010176_075840 [Nonomuraea spiralis]